MKLRDIGERGIVRDIIKKFSIPFDDCAFISLDNFYLLLTTDMIYEETHFPKGARYYSIGWYSIAVNISDIAAKGGEIMGFLVAIAMPRNFEKENLEEILRGMEDCMAKYGGKIFGGDTKEANKLTICISAIGKVRKEEFMPRKGARVGEALYVTGSIGKGAYLYNNEYDKLLQIKPRIREARILAKEKPSCCMDISDGLASSLYQLKEVNGIGFRIYEDLLPMDNIAKKMEKPLEYALYHGGDYELLFTISEEKGKKLENKIDIKRIGEVIEEEKIVIVKNGKEKEVGNRGYEHFIS